MRIQNLLIFFFSIVSFQDVCAQTDNSVHSTQLEAILGSVRGIEGSINQLKLARFAVEPIESLELSEELDALLSQEARSSLPILDLAVRIRRDIELDESYLMTPKGRKRLSILQHEITTFSDRMQLMIDSSVRAIRTYQDDKERLAQTSLVLAKAQLVLDGDWKKSSLLLFESVAPGLSISETELTIALDHLHVLFVEIITRQKKRILEADSLARLLDEYRNQAIEAAIEEWVLENKSLVPGSSRIADADFVGSIRKALQEQGDLRVLVQSRIDETDRELDQILKWAESLATGLATKAKAHPQEVYKILIEGLEP